MPLALTLTLTRHLLLRRIARTPRRPRPGPSALRALAVPLPLQGERPPTLTLTLALARFLARSLTPTLTLTLTLTLTPTSASFMCGRSATCVPSTSSSTARVGPPYLSTRGHSKWSHTWGCHVYLTRPNPSPDPNQASTRPGAASYGSLPSTLCTRAPPCSYLAV